MWPQRIIIVAVLVILFEGWLSFKFGLRKIQYARWFDTSSCFEGEHIHVIEQIENRKLLPVPWIRVEAKIDKHLVFGGSSNLKIRHGEYHLSLFSLMPFTRITRKHSVKCKKRGFYTLSSVAITSGSLLGSSGDYFREFQTDSSLYVYPRPASIKEVLLPSHSWQGDCIVRRWIIEDPFVIHGIREYQDTDSFNRINWKATARVGRLQVNQYAFTAQSKLMVYLNIDTTETQWTKTSEEELVEKGICWAAAITQYALSNCIETGFGSNGYLKFMEKEPVVIKPALHAGQLEMIYQAMARLVILRSLTFYTFLERDVLRGVSNQDYLIITSYVDDKIQTQINRLRKAGNSVEVLVLEREEKNVIA